MGVVFCDFETRSTIDLRKCGAHVYAADPTTDILCLAYAFDHGPIKVWCPGEPLPKDLFRHVADGGKVIGHNVGFEFLIWNSVGRKKYAFPRLNAPQLICTMAMSYAMALPGSLDNASAAVGIQDGKDMVGHRTMMQLSQPRDVLPDNTIVWWDDPVKFERLVAYCVQDVKVERELYAKLMALSPSEDRVWQLDHRINSRGIRVDLPAVAHAIALVEAEKDRYDQEMRNATGNQVATCNATGQLTQWLKFRGVTVDGVAKADVVELLEFDSLPTDCRRALLLRQEAAKSSTAKLMAMQSRASSDGRLRGTTQYHGAGTGRWAGRGVQVQNLKRPTISQADIDDVFSILGEIQ